MAAYDPYDPPYERERRYDDRPRHETYTRERESERLKPYSTSSRDLVRHRDSDLSVEEVRRDFPPPGYRDVRRARSAEPGYDYDYDRRYEPEHRSRGKGAASLYYQEEEARRKRVSSKQEKILAAFAGAALALGGKEAYDRYDANKEGHDVERNYLTSAALGAAGALAGYQGAELYSKHSAKEEKRSTHAVYQGRDGRYELYSDDDGDGPAKKSHKKFLESILGVTSMGAAMKALTGGGDDKSSRRGRSRSTGRSRSSSRARGTSRSKLQKAAMASLIAGATEAFRISKEPGGWKGEKAKRVLTAAAGAGALGGAHNPGHDKTDILQSVLGGLIGNRVVHGSKKNIEADDRDPGRSRSRSRARSSSRGGGGSGGGATGLAALATAGLTALTAKKAIDRSRSRSRSRRRGSFSDGSRSPPRRQRSRSRSVVDGARKGLAKLGIGSGPADDSDRRESRRASSRRRRDSDHDDYGYDDDYRGSSRREKSRDRGSHYDERDDRSYRRRKGARSDTGSETDLGNSDDDDRRDKKMRDRRR